MSGSLNIVLINVTVTLAPAPSTLQQTGAVVSQGATTNAIGSLTPLYSYAGLATMLAGAKTLASTAHSPAKKPSPSDCWGPSCSLPTARTGSCTAHGQTACWGQDIGPNSKLT